MVNPFSFSSVPRIVFGPGKIRQLPALLSDDVQNLLVVTGKSSYKSNKNFNDALDVIKKAGISVFHEQVDCEPTPAVIDGIVNRNRDRNIGEVIGAGGGSVMDTAKAVSAMLTVKGGVKDYLEGLPDMKVHPGTHVRLIAIPTTSGTGSEATKNAVISETGPEGFKRSLRHDNFIPAIALVDPELTTSCPPGPTAASGMDALTQLLESYVSTKANPVSDALAFSGLKQVAAYLERVWEEGSDIEARSGMAYGALCSGITLANAGLGTVHGFASSVGGRFEIPHGVICGTLLAPVTEITIRKLRKTGSNPGALKKYAESGMLFSGNKEGSQDYFIDLLISELHRLTEKLEIPDLVSSGFDRKEVEAIAAKTSCKNNPVQQTREELIEIMECRL